MPSIGRTAVVTDPEGTAFHLFTPEKKDEPVNIIGGLPGQPCWLELLVDNTDKIKGFYGELLSWTFKEQDMGSSEPYILAHSGEAMVCGIMKRPPEVPKMPLWLPYFMVPNVEESCQLAETLGGKKHMGPMTVPTVGTFSLYEDVTGAVSYIFQGEG